LAESTGTLAAEEPADGVLRHPHGVGESRAEVKTEENGSNRREDA
jgi:hypothetical protein